MELRRANVACRVCALAVFAGVGLGAQSGPPPQSAFRATVNLIPVDVSVLDRNRRPMRGLTAADFVVLEDGRPRPVVAFSEIEIPSVDIRTPDGGDGASAPWTRDVAPDVVGNELPAEGRLVAILFDRSIPLGRPVQTAREIATAAIDQLGPGDLAAVTRSSGFANEGRRQGFTADRRLLMDAIDSPMTGMTSTELNPSPVPGQDPSTTDCYCGLCVFETIGHIATAMRDAPERRKMLLFVGSAITIQEPLATSECFSVVKPPRDRMMRELELSNVTVHSLDPAGLFTTALTAGFNTKDMSPMAMTRLPAQYNRQNAIRLDNLRVLPDHTGGRLVSNTNAPADLMPAVFAESRSYYLIGFEPAAVGDDTFHRIEVRVNRPGVTVQARRWHSSSPPATLDDDMEAAWTEAVPADLAAALRSPLPRAGLGLTMNTVTLPVSSGSTSPLAVILGAALSPITASRSVSIAVGAVDQRGSVLALHRQTVELPAADEGAGRVDEGLVARLDLPPGQFEIRAAVRDDVTGGVGSVYGFVRVPEAEAGRLAMSDIVLRGPAPPLMPDHPMSDVIPFVPTVTRRFAASHAVVAFVQVRAETAETVALRTTIVDVHDAVRFEQRQTLAPNTFNDGMSGAQVPLALSAVPPGEYLLRIEASSGSETVTRDVRFTVER
jgi:VWFA-related protein